MVNLCMVKVIMLTNRLRGHLTTDVSLALYTCLGLRLIKVLDNIGTPPTDFYHITIILIELTVCDSSFGYMCTVQNIKPLDCFLISALLSSMQLDMRFCSTAHLKYLALSAIHNIVVNNIHYKNATQQEHYYIP